MKNAIEPYRLFFPLGIFYGIWGVMGWISYYLQLDIAYPVQNHFNLMTYGFMLAFICGFVMTATPKQTHSWPAAKYEIFSIIGLMIINTLFIDNTIVLYASTTLIFIIMNLFIYDRYQHRKNDVDTYFVFIRIGFMIGLVHSVLSWLNAIFFIDFISTQFMKILFYDGFVLMIVLGVGSTLIPNMFGYKQMNVFQISGSKKRTGFSKILSVFVFVMLASFLLDLFVINQFGKIIRFILLAVLFNSRLHILKLPPVRTGFTLSIWLSVWMSILGYGLSAFFPIYYIHAFHLMLIGGFGLMILLVASRVTLAHGNHGFALEVKSKLFHIMTGFIILTAFTRYTAIFWEHIYVSHLGYSAIIWALVLVVWAFYFFKKMLILKS